jgi:hypothetical protein
VALDPAWIWAVLAGVELAGARKVVQCMHARGRYPDKRQDVRDSVRDGYTYRLTESLAEVIRQVDGLREPAHETEDGWVEATPIEDILATADLHAEKEQLQLALEDAIRARACARRCRGLDYGLGAALVPVLLLVPIPAWPLVADRDIVTGGWLYVILTLIAVFAVASLVLFVLAIRAEDDLQVALLEQGPSRERIGG